jgi:hypothetical protein
MDKHPEEQIKIRIQVFLGRESRTDFLGLVLICSPHLEQYESSGLTCNPQLQQYIFPHPGVLYTLMNKIKILDLEYQHKIDFKKEC